MDDAYVVLQLAPSAESDEQRPCSRPIAPSHEHPVQEHVRPRGAGGLVDQERVEVGAHGGGVALHGHRGGNREELVETTVATLRSVYHTDVAVLGGVDVAQLGVLAFARYGHVDLLQVGQGGDLTLALEGLGDVFLENGRVALVLDTPGRGDEGRPELVGDEVDALVELGAHLGERRHFATHLVNLQLYKVKNLFPEPREQLLAAARRRLNALVEELVLVRRRAQAGQHFQVACCHERQEVQAVEVTRRLGFHVQHLWEQSRLELFQEEPLLLRKRELDSGRLRDAGTDDHGRPLGRPLALRQTGAQASLGRKPPRRVFGGGQPQRRPRGLHQFLAARLPKRHLTLDPKLLLPRRARHARNERHDLVVGVGHGASSDVFHQQP